MLSEVIFGKDSSKEDVQLIKSLLGEHNYAVQTLKKIEVDDDSYQLKVSKY